MVNLQLQLLGELKVIRNGLELDLPPSKKTRALLAYLAVNQKKFTREHLCELLWELPDDPRGSLRWSLSKIRRLVDDDSFQRIEADRNHVSLKPEQLVIDCNELHMLVAKDLQSVAIEKLMAAARNYRGDFLATLELANFSEFSVWCLAERESVNRDKELLLNTIVSRLHDKPEHCLEFAMQRVSLRPYEKDYRIKLIELLIAAGRNLEAEQQVELGRRLFKDNEADAIDLHQAWIASKQNARTINHDMGSSPSPQSSEKPPVRKISAIDAGLVGRDNELVAMRSSIEHVLQDKRAHCLLYRGDAGIGKSSLMQCANLLAQQHGARVLRAGAFESEVVRPFALWNDALRESCYFAAAELLSGDERIDRDKLFASISKLIAEQAQKSPVVVLFDDIQWSDESSAAALHYVLRMNAGQALWVVLGAREEELKSNHPMLSALRGLRHDEMLTSILLSPLKAADIRSLVAARAPVADVDTITEKSLGNPLLAIELARAAAAGDVIGTLNELIAERIARIGAATVTLLEWAAILAPRISIGSLLRYTRLDDETLEHALEEAEKSGLLFPNEKGFAFSHELVTRCIYRSIAPSRRQSMHHRVAQLLEADTAIDLKLATELARHAARSGDPLLAAKSLLQASRLCLRFYANDDAFNQAKQGMLFVQQLSEVDRVCLSLELKEVLLMAAPVKDWEAAVEECIALAESALDHGEQASARLGYQMASNIRWAHGHWSGARKSILQAERVSRGGSEVNHIIGMAEVARCLLLLEKDLPEADAMLMEASSRAKRNHIESDALPAAEGMMRYYENKWDEAEELLDEARTRAKAKGDRMNEFQANEYLAMIEIEKGDFAAAALRCKKLLVIGEKLRRGSEAPFAQALSTICNYAKTRTDSGIDVALQLLRQFDAKQRLTYALNRTALIDMEVGKCQSAIAHANEALENAQSMERISEIILARSTLAEASRAVADELAFKAHLQALLATPKTAGAQWARDRASRLIQTLSD